MPYAALCRVARCVRPLRSGFALEFPVELPLHRAALGMPHASALLKVFADSAGDDLSRRSLPSGLDPRVVAAIPTYGASAA